MGRKGNWGFPPGPRPRGRGPWGNPCGPTVWGRPAERPVPQPTGAFLGSKLRALVPPAHPEGVFLGVSPKAPTPSASSGQAPGRCPFGIPAHRRPGLSHQNTTGRLIRRGDRSTGKGSCPARTGGVFLGVSPQAPTPSASSGQAPGRCPFGTPAYRRPGLSHQNTTGRLIRRGDRSTGKGSCPARTEGVFQGGFPQGAAPLETRLMRRLGVLLAATWALYWVTVA